MSDTAHKTTFPVILGIIIATILVLVVLMSGYQSRKNQETPAPLSQVVVESHTYTKQLAPGFPTFPTYPQAELVDSYRNQENELVGFGADWTANATMTQAIDFFTTNLASQGWTITSYPDKNDQIRETSMMAQKDGQTAYITFEREQASEPLEISVEIPYQVADNTFAN